MITDRFHLVGGRLIPVIVERVEGGEYIRRMGNLAEAFVNFLARVHESGKTVGVCNKEKAEQAVTDAAKNLMGLYVGYKHAAPKEDEHDAFAINLIENVEDMETFAAYAMTKK
jgi:hypothetical protein